MRFPVGRAWLAVLCGLVGASGSAAPAGVGDEASVSYLREVRPLLAQYCFKCHGPDEAARAEDLRLDLREGAFAARGSKQVIAPGDPARSLVWQRLSHADVELRMPPAEEAKQPSAAERATIERWIRQGAAWEDHWAFVPPVAPPLPSVRDAAWVRDPLDAFVRARLEQQGLAPRPEAGREAWLRRASLDLTGLPPTPAELDEFLADARDDAHARQVDRLLASPRYGERQAQEWLDLARYADTNGYQNDTPRQIWKWREWVIGAFNRNLPFDQFTIEQLAGDLLPNATLDQKVATGFNRNHPTNSEAGEEEDEYRSAYVIDRVNTTSTAFMGLTLACVQCHDHKYDPLSQRDYYGFYAFFNNIKERDSDYKNPRPSIAVPNPDQAPRLADLKARIDGLKARLEKEDPLSDAAQSAWEARALERLGEPIAWTTVTPAGMLARNGTQLKQLEDGSILSTGTAAVKDTYDFLLQPGQRKIAALRIEVLPDPSAPEQGLGRASDGRFILTALELRNSTFSDSEDPPLVYLSTAQADLNQKVKEDPASYDMFPGSIESAIVVEPVGGEGKGRGFGRGWSIVDDERKRPHEAVLVPLAVLETNESSVLRLALHHTSSAKFKSLIGRLRLSVTDDPRVREWLMPAQTKLWSALGPFPAEDALAAYTTAFAIEKDLGERPLDLKQSYAKAAPGSAAKPPAEKPGPAEFVGPPAPPELVAKAEAAPADDKPADKPAAKPVEKAAEKPAGKDAEQPAPPEKLTWNEERLWRDGAPARLKGANAAWYVTRKVHSTRARTAELAVDGPAGFKLWLNGEPVHAVAPEPALAAAKKPGEPGKKDEAKKDEAKPDDDEEPAEPEKDEFDFAAMFGESRSKTEKRFRIGLRQGENELVLKLVFAGEPRDEARGPGGGAEEKKPGPRQGGDGGSFTFRLTAEGDDVLTHEVATALRREALERANPTPSLAADTAAAPAPATGGQTGPHVASARPAATGAPAAPATPGAQAAPAPTEPKVSLVGELSAPLKSAEEVNPLTPAERRRKVLREHYRTVIDPVGRVLAAELRALEEEQRELERRVPQTMVMEELEQPRQAYVFGRGLYKNRGADIGPGTPAVLPPLDAALPKNRLGLARWLVSGRHPLTARVLVNRIWQQYFGLGLVRTAEDFGVRSEPPTHPELLDHLALTLVESGWDLKALHKRIVLSATYRQDATLTPAALERDPENRLLARGPRLRLSAEMVRDQALAVAGLLVEKQGGESVKPRQPKNAWKTVEGNTASSYQRHKDERQYRRSLYVYWKRGAPYPSLLNFDAAKRDACTVSRATTTTPLQALTLLNDPVFVECAKMFAQRLLKERQALGRARDPQPAEQDALRLRYGFRLCTSRAPTEQEAQLLLELLAEQRQHYQADLEAARKLLEVGDARLDPELDVREAAAWTGVASALLNLDATLHRG